MNRLLLLAVAASIGLSACSKKDDVASPASAPMSAGANSGKVVQTQQAGGYTYAQVDLGGQQVWIAGGPIEIKPGDTVQWGQYAVMRNFTAKSLGRTFDEILFVESWGPAGGAAAKVPSHGMYPNQQAAQTAMPQAGPAGAGSNQGQVKSVANAGGYTYLEVNQGGATVWIAAPETSVKVGDKVTWDGGATMQNFTAKSLGRTFDQIVFAGGVAVVK